MKVLPERVKYVQLNRQLVLLISALCLILLSANSIVAQAMTTMGNVAAVQNDISSEMNPSVAQSYWNTALWFDGLNANAYLALARSAYKTGAMADGFSYTQRGLAVQPDNPRLLALLGDIYIEYNEPKLALDAYEAIGYSVDPNRLAHAYQRWGKDLMGYDQQTALVAFEKALLLNPDSLYALYQLYKLDNSYSDLLLTRLTKPYSEAWLKHPPSLSYDAKAAILACHDGLIDCETIVNFLHLATWLGDPNVVLPSIADMCTRNSVDTRICTRLLSDACIRTAFSHEHCLEIRNLPVDNGDVMTMSTPSALQPNENSLAGNLIPNSGAEKGIGKTIESWQWVPAFSAKPHPRFGLGYFAGGRDCDVAGDGQCSLRIQGLWREETPGLGSPRAGYASSRIMLTANRCYRLSFIYRTLPYSKSTVAGINTGLQESGGEIILPDTSGEWIFHQIDIQPEESKETGLTFRMWGVGAVWYDRIQLNTVECSEK